MQYWIFSYKSVGRFEFCNLLEHADNVVPADGMVTVWRTVTNPDGSVGFTPPRWVNEDELFQTAQGRFATSKYILNPVFTRLIEQGKNTVIPADVNMYLDYINIVPFKDLITTDIHKIFLYSTNTQRLLDEINRPPYLDPELIPFVQEQLINSDPLDPTNKKPVGGYDTYIEMDRIWTDWDYLNTTLSNIGINLSRKAYDTYLIKAQRP